MLLGLAVGTSLALWLTHTLWLPRQRIHGDPPVPRQVFALNSSLPYHQVSVPFTLENNGIFVPVQVGTKHIKVAIDTGCTDDFQIPQSYQLQGPDIGIEASDYKPSPRATSRSAKLILLPEVRLGGYTLKHCPTLVYPFAKDEPAVNGVPTLGNTFFSGIVLTFDFQKKLLILRDADYRLETEKQEPTSQIIDFDWIFPVDYGIGVPSCDGTVNSQPVKIMLDTGMYGIDIIACTPSLIASLTRSYKHPVHQGLFLNQDWTLGNQKYHGTILTAPDWYLGTDASMGLALLENYRLTIDYPRQKILMQYRPLPIRSRPIPAGSKLTTIEALPHQQGERIGSQLWLQRTGSPEQ